MMLEIQTPPNIFKLGSMVNFHTMNKPLTAYVRLCLCVYARVFPRWGYSAAHLFFRANISHTRQVNNYRVFK